MVFAISFRSLTSFHRPFHLKTTNYCFKASPYVYKASFFKSFQNTKFQNQSFLQKHCFSVLPGSKDNSIHSFSLAHFNRKIFVSSRQSCFHTCEGKISLSFMLGIVGISMLMQANDILSEKAIVKTIRTAIDQENRFQEMMGMKNLGDVYFQKNTPKALIQAAGLYNYVHRIAVELNDAKEQEKALQRLALVEERFLTLFSSSSKINQKQFSENRKKLEDFREQIDQGILSLKTSRTPKEVALLHERIAQEIKKIISDLINQSIEILGPPPCFFSTIGFGSLAREETTPYSDLEFGFLIKRDTPENKEYFRRLAYLIHLRVVNLGETILPCLNIPSLKGVFDGTTPRGFSFDGEGVQGKGCKTPFGNTRAEKKKHKVFELIQTPSKMAQYQGKDERDGKYWFEKNSHLPLELQNVVFIETGHQKEDEELVGKYLEMMSKELDQVLDLEGIVKIGMKQKKNQTKTTTIREYMAKNLLSKSDKEAFDPNIRSCIESGKIFSAKKDFYRLPHLSLERVCLLKSLQGSTTFEKLNELEKAGMLSELASKEISFLIAQSMWLRLKSYNFYKSQKDWFDIFQPDFVERNQFKRKQKLHQEEKDLVIKMYQILIPLHRWVWNLLENSKEKPLKRCLDESLLTKGIIYSRLLDFPNAFKYYQMSYNQEVDTDRNKFTILVNLGAAFLSHGKNEKALNVFEKAINLIDKNQLEIKEQERAHCLAGKGVSLLNLGKHSEAFTTFEKVLRIQESFGEKDEIDLADTSINLGTVCHKQGDLEKALEWFQKAYQIYEVKGSSKNFELNKALACHNMGASLKALKRNREASEKFQEAYKIRKKWFDNKPHPDIAKSLIGLGYTLILSEKYEEALEKFQEAHVIQKRCITPSIEKANSLEGIGMALVGLKLFEEGYENLKKALSIKLEEENSIESIEKTLKALLLIPNTLFYQGETIQNQGKYGQAIDKFKQALKYYSKMQEILGDFQILEEQIKRCKRKIAECFSSSEG